MNLHHLDGHWLGIFGTVMVVIAYIPQVTHLMKMHCGDGVSILAYALWAASSAFLCVYAIMVKEPLFIALQGYHTAACGLILFFGIKHKMDRCPMHRNDNQSQGGEV